MIICPYILWNEDIYEYICGQSGEKCYKEPECIEAFELMGLEQKN